MCDNTTVEITNSARPILEHERAERIGYTIVVPIVCSLGLIFNILNLIIFTKKTFRSVSYTMMAALAVADAITLFFTMPVGMSRCGNCDISSSANARIFFEIYFYLPFTNFSETLSVWITLALSVERYISMQYYGLSKIICTRENAFKLLGGLVIVSTALNMPYFFLYKIECSKRVSLPLNDNEAFNTFSLFRLILVQFLPLILLTMINGALMYSVYRAEQRRSNMGINITTDTRKQTRETKRQRAQTKLTILLISIIFLCLLGNIPVAFAYEGIYELIFGKDSVKSSHFAILRTTTHILSLFSYALNFILYCALNKHFLAAVIVMCGCARRRSSNSTVTPMNKKDAAADTGHNMGSVQDDDHSKVSSMATSDSF